MLTLDLGLSASETVKKVNFCCLSPPSYGVLLWQLNYTEISIYYK